MILFDSPYFEIIVAFLDITSAIHLRGTCRCATTLCSSEALSEWRQKKVLPALKNVWKKDAPIMTDQHTMWLYDNVVNTVTKAEFGRAPFITDALVKKIAHECPALEFFSMRRGSNNLRIKFYFPLRRLTTEGPCTLVEQCPRLKHLCLSWCENVDAAAVCQFIRANPAVCKGLTYLNLDGVPCITNIAISALSSCTNLETLRMRDTVASDLSPLAACTKMVSLHVCRGRGIDPDSVIQACRGFKDSITDLCCGGCKRIDADTALAVLDLCPHLEVWSCLRGTAAGYGRRDEIRAAAERRRGDEKVCLDNPCCDDAQMFDFM